MATLLCAGRSGATSVLPHYSRKKPNRPGNAKKGREKRGRGRIMGPRERNPGRASPPAGHKRHGQKGLRGHGDGCANGTISLPTRLGDKVKNRGKGTSRQAEPGALCHLVTLSPCHRRARPG